MQDSSPPSEDNRESEQHIRRLGQIVKNALGGAGPYRPSQSSGGNTNQKYSISDRLGIALACLGAVLAIVLFLIEKTPLAVAGCLLAILVLLVFPVLHFFHKATSRSLVFAVVIILLGSFGLVIWPRKKITSDAGTQKREEGLQQTVVLPAPTLVTHKSKSPGRIPMSSTPTPVPTPLPVPTPNTEELASLIAKKLLTPTPTPTPAPKPICRGDNLRLCSDEDLLEWGRPLMAEISRYFGYYQDDLKKAQALEGRQLLSAHDRAKEQLAARFKDCCAEETQAYYKEIEARLGGGHEEAEFYAWNQRLIGSHEGAKDWPDICFYADSKILDIRYNLETRMIEFDGAIKRAQIRGR